MLFVAPPAAVHTWLGIATVTPVVVVIVIDAEARTMRE